MGEWKCHDCGDPRLTGDDLADFEEHGGPMLCRFCRSERLRADDPVPKCGMCGDPLDADEIERGMCGGC